MSEKVEKVVDINGNETSGEPEEIKGTDYVEPTGKVRKVLKWIIGGVALLVTGVVGAIIGKNLGDSKEEESNSDSAESSSNETTEE